MSPKQFRQVLANFGFVMSDEELQSLVKTYGNEQNDIQYLRFIDDANPNKGVVPSSENLPTSSKSSYTDTTLLFKGEDNFEKLMTKIKNQIKKDRIRLGEFFQDHDLLRKGVLPAQKFRGVLYTQKLLLADDEFDLLESRFAHPADKTKVNYVAFNEEIEQIFTHKDLEKNPTKKLETFKPPSILDPKNVLNDEED